MSCSSLWRRAALALILVAGVVSLRADEGFWPYNGVPRTRIARAHGFEVTDAWLDHLRLSSVKFGGASGSFVSPDGLVLTNHHVGLGTLSKLSTAARDLVKHGFYARTRAEELKAPDLELAVLQGIEDVTSRVDAAVTPGMSQADALAARKAAIAAIEKESTDRTGLRSDVVVLYQGAQYHLYRYKRYTDVRLVFAPEYDIAFFGGDTDNFTYPRYCLDVTIFRVYEDDRPARVEHYLRWSPNGAREGELVFTSGHPGGTERLYTVAHLEYLRDVSIPSSVIALERRRQSRLKYAALGEEQARQVKQEIFGLENALKSQRGQLDGLRSAALMGRKRTAEEALRAAVAADPARQREFGTAWDDIAKSRTALRAFANEYSFVERAGGFDSRLYTIARDIVRLVRERELPDVERLAEYSDARRASLERQLFSPAPIYAAAEKAKLADSLVYMRERLGASHPVVKQVLAGRDPQARAAELVDGTMLADVAARRALVAGGKPVVAASTDAMVQLARAIDGRARELRVRYDNEILSAERDGYAKVARAVFAVQGTDAYPDGTSTLRLSYGTIQGYRERGAPVAPFTQFAGLFERQAQFGARPPHDAPQRWDDRRDVLDLQTPFDLVSTNDIVGGNSGSPLVNTRGEVVGLVFDGNIQSLPGYFVFEADVNRAVSVDARAIIEALRRVYDAGPLADEIVGVSAGPEQTAAGMR